MKYVYVARFELESDGQYTVFFPDFNDAATCGKDLAQAIYMAGDLLGNLLYDVEESGKDFPKPTPMHSFPYKENSENLHYSPVLCDLVEFKKRVSDAPVRKTVYISKGLNDAAEERGLNFSQLLRDAIQREISQ